MNATTLSPSLRFWKSDQFQSDLYPDTAGDEPALSLEDYFAGKSSEPKKIKLEGGFKPSAKKEFVASSSASQQDEDAAAPKTEKEVAYPLVSPPHSRCSIKMRIMRCARKSSS